MSIGAVVEWRVFKYGLCPFVFVILTLLWLAVRFRNLQLIPLCLALIWYIQFLRGKSFLRVAFAWVIVVVFFWFPFDVSIIRRPGPPRIVPLVMGLPPRDTAARGGRGEVVLGGCVASGLEPRYVLVW